MAIMLFLFIPETAQGNVEGGIYISPEFQLGQVYDGNQYDNAEDIVLYRPHYVCIPHDKVPVTNTNNAFPSTSGVSNNSAATPIVASSSKGDSKDLDIETELTSEQMTSV